MGVVHISPPPPGDYKNLVDYGQFAQEHLGVSCQQIAEQVLTGSAANIDFVNIPQTYRDLLLTFNGRSDDTPSFVNMSMRFNGDTAANYDTEYLKGVSATASATESPNSIRVVIGMICAAAAPANKAGFVVARILDYTSAVWEKMVTSTWGFKTADAAGGIDVGHSAGFWRNVAPITQVTIYPATGNYVADSRATLWGMV